MGQPRGKGGLSQPYASSSPQLLAIVLPPSRGVSRQLRCQDCSHHHDSVVSKAVSTVSSGCTHCGTAAPPAAGHPPAVSAHHPVRHHHRSWMACRPWCPSDRPPQRFVPPLQTSNCPPTISRRQLYLPCPCFLPRNDPIPCPKYREDVAHTKDLSLLDSRELFPYASFAGRVSGNQEKDTQAQP